MIGRPAGGGASMELKCTMPILMQMQKHYFIVIDNPHQQEVLLTVELRTMILRSTCDDSQST